MYPHPYETALANGEVKQFSESRTLNHVCIKAIDAAIRDSNYELYRYDLKTAMQTVVEEFGFERVDWVMAGLIRQHDYDGRYSQRYKDWARELDVPERESRQFVFDTHPCVLDGFADRLREVHTQDLTQTGPEEAQVQQQCEFTEDLTSGVFPPRDYDEGPEEGPVLSL